VETTEIIVTRFKADDSSFLKDFILPSGSVARRRATSEDKAKRSEIAFLAEITFRQR